MGAFILDFYCSERRLVVEVDGSQHLDATAAYDAERTAWLQSQGIRVLRFDNLQVLAETDAVLAVILEALTPSP